MDLNAIWGSWETTTTTYGLYDRDQQFEMSLFGTRSYPVMVHRVECMYSAIIMAELDQWGIVEFELGCSIGATPNPSPNSPRVQDKTYWTDSMGWLPERSAAPGTGAGQWNNGFIRQRLVMEQSKIVQPNEALWFEMDLQPWFLPDEGLNIARMGAARAYHTALA